MCCPYITVLTLIFQLNDGPHIKELFTRACQGLRETSVNFEMAILLLQATRMLGTQFKVDLPEEAIKYLGDPTSLGRRPFDVPSEISIPTIVGPEDLSDDEAKLGGRSERAQMRPRGLGELLSGMTLREVEED